MFNCGGEACKGFFYIYVGQNLLLLLLLLLLLYTFFTSEHFSWFAKDCGSWWRSTALLHEINTDKFSHILLNHNFVNIIRNSNMIQPLKRHLQGIHLIHSSSVFQKSKSPVVKFNLPCSVYCNTALRNEVCAKQFWISQMVIHFVDHTGTVYQVNSLKMTH